MKKKGSYFHVVEYSVLSLALSFFLTSCGGGGGSAATNQPTFLISTTVLPGGRTNQTYTAALQTSGGSGAVSWSISQGALPSGLKLDSSLGKIEGTPTSEGSAQFTVRAQDSSSPPKQTSRSLTISVLAGLIIVTTNFSDELVGVQFEVALEAQNNEGQVTWTLTDGALPVNVNLTLDGRIRGSPASAGVFNFTVQAEDSSSPPQIAQKDLTLTVAGRLLIQVNFVSGYLLNQPYSSGNSFFANRGILPYKNWRVVEGTLPSGLSIDSDSGEIGGTPTEERDAVVVVAMEDSTNPPQSAQAQLLIKPAEPLVFSQFSIDAIQDAKIGREVRVFLNAFSGTVPYVWEVSTGNLPPGINVFSFGQYSGVPTQVGIFSFSLKVTDNTSPSQIIERPFTVRIDDLIVLTRLGGLPVGILTRPYSGFLEASGGTPPYTWASTLGPGIGTPGLPTGLDLDPLTGEISGTPTTSSIFSFFAEVTDSSTPPLTDRQGANILIESLPAFTTTTLKDGIKNFGYFQNIGFVGGLLPRTFSLVSGSLPNGLSFIPSNLPSIEGTPTVLGEFNFTLKLTDGSTPPLSATQDFTLRVNDRLQITTEILPDAIPREFYNFQLDAIGGVSPYTWRVTINELPNGLSLDPTTGIISGFTVSAESSGFQVVITDSSNPFQRDDKTLTIDVPFTLRIDTTRLPDGRAGAPYRVAMVTNDPTGGAKRWSISGGSLPPGLTLDEISGEIIGETNQVGTSTFTVKVQDVTDPTLEATQTFSLTFRDTLPRNDSISTATPISNGWIAASLSPYSDPVETPGPDTDFFEVSAFAGALVEIETFAQSSLNSFGIDTVIEIVDGSGNRFVTCKDPGDDLVSPPVIRDLTGDFDDVCINDDDRTGDLNSFLEFRVPGVPGELVTFYVHVLDYRGDARPDFVYQIKITGAN